MIKYDCHIHALLDGSDWKASIARHREKPQEDAVRAALAAWRGQGFRHLRDGGDRWGVSRLARELAGQYGITYLTPLSPLHKKGHYGGFIGTGFDTLPEFARLVRQVREEGADFLKIMVSGLMDFSRFGVLTEEGLEEETVRQMVHIGHEEGLAVMAHCNGASTALAAARAGVDSIEHGAYLDREALQAMAEQKVLWVPTVSTVGNLLGKGRFPDEEVEKILENVQENIRCFVAMGGLLAPGSDAGAWAVPHGLGGQSEYAWMEKTLGRQADAILAKGGEVLFSRFSGN